jgi:DNA-binding SARP family transcriptional activator
LWQIHTLIQKNESGAPLLVADRHSVRVALKEHVWLDVAAFEKACRVLRNSSDQAITDESAEILESAAQLYTGDLLEGWYQDWCLFERERLRNLYLLILENLMEHCEIRKRYEAGLGFGEKIIQLDCVHERTYQAMMRLLHKAGNRAAAIRLYQRCVQALRKEIGVAPSHKTIQIMEWVRADAFPTAAADEVVRNDPSVLDSVASQLKQFMSVLNNAQNLIENQLRATADESVESIKSKSRLKSLIKSPHQPAS